jgi:tetratricopeptide (TPR) repeat protein
VRPVKVTDADLLENYDEVKASHILVSTREDEEGKALSDAEAKKKAETLLAEVKGGADFAEVAKRESDDPMSGPEGGDLGWVKRGQMVTEFDEAAFALKKGEMSGVVKTSYGYHIIRVEDRRRELPEDFEKNKKQLREGLLQQRQAQAWAAFSQEQREKAKVTIPDPELRGDIAFVDGDYDQALKDFQTALKQVDRLGEGIPGAIHFAMGQIYAGRKEWKKAAQALEETKGSAVAELLPVYVALGRVYLELGDKEKARENYEEAVFESPEDAGTLWQLKNGFEKLGDEKQAAEMDRLMQEAWQRQMEEMSERAPREAPPDE